MWVYADMMSLNRRADLKSAGWKKRRGCSRVAPPNKAAAAAKSANTPLSRDLLLRSERTSAHAPSTIWRPAEPNAAVGRAIAIAGGNKEVPNQAPVGA